MSERVVPFPGAPRLPPPVPLAADPRFHRAVLLLGAVLLVFTRLWETTLSSYDDTYYAEKAREILLTGDWLAPHWNFEPRFDNPPLYLWGTAVLFRLFGVSELTARLLSAAAGVGCVWLAYRFGSRLFGEWVGFLSGAALLTTPYFIKYSRHCMLDTTQTLLVGGCLYLLFLGLERDRTLGLDLAAGVLMGLAVLNKSLLGYLPVAIYGVYCLAARVPIRRALRPGLLAAAGAALALPGAWFAAMTARFGSEFLEGHFGTILLQRALEGDPGQQVTLSSYLGYFTGLFSDFLPWIPAALWGGWLLLRGEESRRRGWLPLCWALGVLGLLSLSAAKKSWYVMPAFPALAILAGYGLDRFLGRWPSGRERFAVGISLVLLAFHLFSVVTPVPLDRDRNRDVAAIAPAARAAVPEGEHVISFALEPHWRYVSALLFYAQRPLSLPVQDPGVMERVIRNAEAPAVLTDVTTYGKLQEHLERAPRILAASGDLVLIAPP
jgi:4-amino-4-deoxy-L-arabinose transferase-like glycosyltransferase